MDQAVIKYYRKLLDAGFEHAGSVDKASILLDAVGEGMRICDHVGHDSLRLYISIEDERVTLTRYLCTCDPTTNVAVEMLCTLIEGQTLGEIDSLRPESFSRLLGSESEDLARKAKGLIELLSRGIARYKAERPAPEDHATRGR
jgi:hypothetical protein